MISKFELNATMVANEFIDQYMTVANGEYVKVYLYLMRHQERPVTVLEVADALNHTESDVRRAMAYWTRLGVLLQKKEDEQGERQPREKSKERDASCLGKGLVIWDKHQSGRENQENDIQNKDNQNKDSQGEEAVIGFRLSQAEQNRTQEAREDRRKADLQAGTDGRGDGGQAEVVEPGIPKARVRYTSEQIGRLAKDEEFTQLLYISQKYMNKVFTPRECEVFAYLYDGLRMPVELLEYLVEYCVQGEHYSIRYLETVAIDWHERRITTVDMARQYTTSFSNEAFAVMKAFGLNDRRPGDTEMAMIHRWFKEWGFTRELVLEACGRTLKATHKPSFPYADKILEEWKKVGVRTMADVKKMDEKRENRQASGSSRAVSRQSRNQFHNFEQRNTNYDAMVLERLKQRLEEA